MATVGELINKGLCGSSEIGGGLGTETSKGCATLITAAKIIVAIAPNAEIRKGEELYAEIDRLMLEGKMRILRGVESFEENGSDDAVETAADDTMKITNEGKYAFLVTFSKGLFFNKAMHSLKGFKRWNVMIIDEQRIYGVETKTGLKGFATGMFQPQKISFPSNTTSQTEGLRFQFLERYELDQDYGFINDTSLRKLKGITEIELEYVNEPMAGDTTLTARAVLAMDNGILYEGATFGDFRLTVNGEERNPTAGDDSTTSGRYPLTFPAPALASGDKVLLSMPVHKGPDGDYYKSSGQEVIVP